MIIFWGWSLSRRSNSTRNLGSSVWQGVAATQLSLDGPNDDLAQESYIVYGRAPSRDAEQVEARASWRPFSIQKVCLTYKISAAAWQTISVQDFDVQLSAQLLCTLMMLTVYTRKAGVGAAKLARALWQPPPALLEIGNSLSMLSFFPRAPSIVYWPQAMLPVQ